MTIYAIAVPHEWREQGLEPMDKASYPINGIPFIYRAENRFLYPSGQHQIEYDPNVQEVGDDIEDEAGEKLTIKNAPHQWLLLTRLF